MCEELKKCPHCGGPVRIAYNMELIPYGVTCSTCHTITTFTRIKPPKPREPFERVLGEIAQAWNRRDGA